MDHQPRDDPSAGAGDPFAGAGTLRPALEAVDWDGTSLGSVGAWSPQLRLTLGTVLSTRFPAALFWGPDLVVLYNEAYVALIEDKHPAALGRAARDVFPEAWDVIGPMFAGVLAGGPATWVEDSRLTLTRRGFDEECHFTFSYSPVTASDGAVAGVLDIAAETTRNVLDRRRLALVAELGQRLVGMEHLDELPRLALPLLRGSADDLPVVGLHGHHDVVGDPSDGTAVPAWDDRLPAPPPGAAGADRLVHEVDGRTVVWSRLPGVAARAERPLLVVQLSERLAPDEQYLELLDLLAQTLGTALERARTQELERAASRTDRAMSEQLQRSLLADLPEPDHLELVARYHPAAADLQVGGDWYDAFLVADGSTTLVVGDVTGHDRGAAVAMAQMRNVLRGVAYAYVEPPAAVLEMFDAAMRDLAVGALATAVLATVEQTQDQREAGLRLLRWSNAGHPPPVLVHPDGRAELLARPADLLLGLGTGFGRRDHAVVLQPGATVLLYSDGLVERRDRSLTDGMEWLRAAVQRRCSAGATLDELCDGLLEEVGGALDDDVVLLALRAHPEDRPRPAAAGPRTLPASFIRAEDEAVQALRPG